MNWINEKLKTTAWFLRRPKYRLYMCELATRKVRINKDSEAHRQRAIMWARARVVSVTQALEEIELLHCGAEAPSLPEELIDEGDRRAKLSNAQMGGPGDLNLLYAVAKLSCAKRVVETGVAYGWSSLAILAAISCRHDACLVSVDMPYPKMNNEPFVGIVVPEQLRATWEVIREPDRRGLEKAIARFGGTIDLCHYDSDKSYWGRAYAYPLLWNALRPRGVFISDDIQDNMAFADFMQSMNCRCAVTQYASKFVGIARKPELGVLALTQ